MARYSIIGFLIGMPLGAGMAFALGLTAAVIIGILLCLAIAANLIRKTGEDDPHESADGDWPAMPTFSDLTITSIGGNMPTPNLGELARKPRAAGATARSPLAGVGGTPVSPFHTHTDRTGA